MVKKKIGGKGVGSSKVAPKTKTKQLSVDDIIKKVTDKMYLDMLARESGMNVNQIPTLKEINRLLKLQPDYNNKFILLQRYIQILSKILNVNVN